MTLAVVGKPVLALHHAVPVEAVAPVSVLAWDGGLAGLGSGEFYPGRPRPTAHAQHRSQRGAHISLDTRGDSAGTSEEKKSF